MCLPNRSWQESNTPGVFAVAALIGIISGLICVLVRQLLQLLQWIATGHIGYLADAAAQLPLWRRVLIPVLGAIVATLVIKSAHKFFGQLRSVDYIEAVRLHKGRIPWEATLWRTLSSIASIASGASIGREGSMIQFAAACISALGRKKKIQAVSAERLVCLGVAAAVAAVYQAPLAGVFFAVEIAIGASAFSKQAWIEAPALLVSAAAGAIMSILFLGHGPLFPMKSALHFTWHDSFIVLFAALIIGSVGPVYLDVIEGMRWLKKWPYAVIASGLIVGLLSCFRPEVWGNGDSSVLVVMSGQVSLWLLVLILITRLIATSVCVGAGVVGGVFTPTIFAGSVFGLLYGKFISVALGPVSSTTQYAVLGIACLLSAVTHAPLMAALITVELTGTMDGLPLILVSSLVAFETAKALSPDSLYAFATPDPTRRKAERQKVTANS